MIEGLDKRENRLLAGRTVCNRVVLFQGDPSYIGQIVNVQISQIFPNSLRGGWLEWFAQIKMRYMSKVNTNNQCRFELTPASNQALLTLCGEFNKNIDFIANEMTTQVVHRGFYFKVTGSPSLVRKHNM